MQRLRPWLPALLWAGVISFASTDTFSSEHTSRFLLPFLRWLLPFAGEETLALFHFLIRKGGHFGEYFVLSWLLLRGVRGKQGGWQLRWAIAAIAMAAGYSVLDEIHQAFVASRGASGWDSLLDTAGAAAAQLIAWLWATRERKNSRGNAAGPMREVR